MYSSLPNLLPVRAILSREDDHVVAGIGVRRLGRLVLAAQQDCSLGGETAEHHVGGVDEYQS